MKNKEYLIRLTFRLTLSYPITFIYLIISFEEIEIKKAKKIYIKGMNFFDDYFVGKIFFIQFFDTLFNLSKEFHFRVLVDALHF